MKTKQGSARVARRLLIVLPRSTVRPIFIDHAASKRVIHQLAFVKAIRNLTLPTMVVRFKESKTVSSAHVGKLSGNFIKSCSRSASPCRWRSLSPSPVTEDHPELIISRHSRDLLQNLYRAPNPVYATDENNRIIAWNRAAEQLLGHHADVVGKEWCALIVGTDIHGNDFFDRECVKTVRHNRVVKRFDMDVRRAREEIPGNDLRSRPPSTTTTVLQRSRSADSPRAAGRSHAGDRRWNPGNRRFAVYQSYDGPDPCPQFA